jgi:uncharacterized protein YndB with AHSA1/START domain
MTDSIRVSAVIPAPPRRIYEAWLDPRQHSAMTGSRATADTAGRFTAWDGYISGTTIVKEPPRRIVQGWRTSEFPAGSPDSRLEVLLEKVNGGTRVTLVHTEIPTGQGSSYEGGWHQFYLAPMRAYFAGTRAASEEPKKRGAKKTKKATPKPKAKKKPAPPKRPKSKKTKPDKAKKKPAKAKKTARRKTK